MLNDDEVLELVYGDKLQCDYYKGLVTFKYAHPEDIDGTTIFTIDTVEIPLRDKYGLTQMCFSLPEVNNDN